MGDPFQGLLPYPPASGGDWLFVRRDEDGTRVHAYIAGAQPVSEGVVRVWVRYLPSGESQGHQAAERYLSEKGKDAARLGYLLQPWELNLNRGQASDLGICFMDKDGRLLDAVRFRKPAWRGTEDGTIQAALRSAVQGLWREDRFGGDPALRKRLEEKMKELNEAFEEFETCAPEGRLPGKP